MTTESSTQPAADSGKTEFSFQAEVNQVLDIVVHSLYSHREVFLRELISNASDALDKLRFRATTEPEILGFETDYEIRIACDEGSKTLSVSDTGIGMTREEMIENLGTIARSGSKKFKEALKAKGESGGIDLIGQFGVGFYSAFLVAKKVEVTSLAAGANEAWRWTSEANGSFTIEPAPERKRRGTEVLLHVNDDGEEYVKPYRIRELVQRYSDYVGHAIKLRQDGEKEDDDFTWETINKASALWKRPKSEITDEQYDEFYKHLTHDWEKPLARNHFTIEGSQLFTGLLFAPARAPWDLFDRQQRRGVRLYVKRVFIMDDCEQLLPEWLRFVRGIVDSDDLPLNVSRELLQEDRVAKSIKKNVVKKSLDMLEELAEKRPDDYAKFWAAFGVVLKEGLHYDPESKDRLAGLVRYKSSKADLTALAEYVKRMPEGQKAIYYAMGPNERTVAGGPHMEALARKGYEVLYMTDAVDEWAIQGIEEFAGKKLISAMKADLDLGDEEGEEEKKKNEERKGELEKLCERIKAVLEAEVSEVRISKRLTDSPACLVVAEGGPHAHIERLLRAQHKDMPVSKRIFELNPEHAIVRRLRDLEEKKPASAEVVEWIRLLHDQALLAEGSPIDDPQAFARRVSTLMTKALDAEAG
jgi:molecular chaperone HtpG